MNLRDCLFILDNPWVTFLAKFKKKPKLYVAQLISAFSGLLVSLYLLAQHTRLKSGIQGDASFCSLGKFADCDVVNSSQYSEFLGIPLASLGAVYFFLLFIIAILGSPKKPAFRLSQWIIAWLSLVALGIDSILFIIQLTKIGSICLLCLTTYLATAIIFLSALGIQEKKEKDWKQLLKETLFPNNAKNLAKPSLVSSALGLLAVICFAGILVLLPDSLRLRSKTYSVVDSAISQFYEKWKNQKVSDISYSESDGTAGDPNARVRIVEFSDFQCPFCRKAAFTMHNALDPIKDKVFLVFKNFPLDQGCNKSVTFKMHPHACQLARLAYCAKQGGRFWDFHDYVFMRMDDSLFEGDFSEIAKSISHIIPKEEIDLCLKNPQSLAAVKKNIEEGNRLRVTGTPSVFINGKLVTIPLTVETIRDLVALELQASK